LKPPELGLLNVVKSRGGEITDANIVSLIEHQVIRVETCTNTLTMRHMMRPFRPGDRLEDHAVPMADILKQLQVQLAEFKALKDQISVMDPSISVAKDGEDPPSVVGDAALRVNSGLLSPRIMEIGDDGGVEQLEPLAGS